MPLFTSRPGLVIVAPGTSNGVSEPHGAPELHGKVDALANLVQLRWSHRGYQLRMTSAQCAAVDESALRRSALNDAPGHGLLHASTECRTLKTA